METTVGIPRVINRVGRFEIPAHLRPATIGTAPAKDIPNRLRHARFRRKMALKNLGHDPASFPLDASGVPTSPFYDQDIHVRRVAAKIGALAWKYAVGG